MNIYQGGCACGAVRYESRAQAVASLHCCCRQCQRATGAGHASPLALPAAEVTIRGALTFFATTADTGNTVHSGFCPVCGSPILKKSSGYPQMIFLHAASLDHPAQFEPETAVWVSARQPWDRLDPKFEAQ